MTGNLIQSILYTYEKNISILLDICESEIERIFLLKVIDYVIKRPDRYRLSFIYEEVETFIVDEKECVSNKVNIQLLNNFGRISGVRIDDYFLGEHNIEIYPQKEIKYYGDNLREINYRLDFGVFVYDRNSNDLIKKNCIECDGYEYHSEKHQIIRDNERDMNISYEENYHTIRYLGTQIVNFKDKDIGYFFSVLASCQSTSKRHWTVLVLEMKLESGA